MIVYRCAERGCLLGEADRESTNCPTCNNPLAMIVEHTLDDDEKVEQPGADDDADPNDDPESDGDGVDQTPAAPGETPPAAVRKTAARRNRRV